MRAAVRRSKHVPAGAWICPARHRTSRCEWNSSPVRAKGRFDRWFFNASRSYQKEDLVQFDLVLSETFVQGLNFAQQVSQGRALAAFFAQIDFDFCSVGFRTRQRISWNNERHSSMAPSHSRLLLTEHELLLRENIFGEFLSVELFAQFGHVFLQLRDLVFQVLDHLDATFVLLHMSDFVLEQIFLFFVADFALPLQVAVHLLQTLAIGTQSIDLRAQILNGRRGRAKADLLSHLPCGSSPCSFVRGARVRVLISTGRVRWSNHRTAGVARRSAACSSSPAVRSGVVPCRSDSTDLSTAGCCRAHWSVSFADRAPALAVCSGRRARRCRCCRRTTARRCASAAARVRFDVEAKSIEVNEVCRKERERERENMRSSPK